MVLPELRAGIRSFFPASQSSTWRSRGQRAENKNLSAFSDISPLPGFLFSTPSLAYAGKRTMRIDGHRQVVSNATAQLRPADMQARALQDLFDAQGWGSRRTCLAHAGGGQADEYRLWHSPG